MTELFPYQVEGAAFLAKVGRGLLADEPGLGKTAQAIVASAAVGAKVILVLCPSSVVENWRREFVKFWPAGVPKPTVHVVGYASATRRDYWTLLHPDVLIVDECHYLKQGDAQRTKLVYGEECDGVGGLVENAKHVFLLSGTPTPNDPSELWPMLRAMWPESIPDVNERPRNYDAFVNRYCRTKRDWIGKVTIVGGKNLPELKAKIEGKFLRRKKIDVMKDLPPLRTDVLTLDYDWKNLVVPVAEHAHLEERLAACASDEEVVQVLQEEAEHVATLRRLTGLAKVKPVVDWVLDWQRAGGKKIVLFAQHKDVISGLRQLLGQTTAVIDGSTPPAYRQTQVDLFQDERGPAVFIGQIQAAGTGITLTAASDLVFVESSWVPAENEQAAMRIHRIGQQNACLVRFATLAGSIDEQIARACARKLETIRELFA